MRREITLMIYIQGTDDETIKELKEFCINEKILFKPNGFRYRNIYDFTIEGDTSTYKKISDKFENKIIQTGYAELGNIFDLDNETLDKWKDVIDRYNKDARTHTNLFVDFCDLIMGIKDVYKFEHLLKYPFDNSTENLIKDRISQLKGEKIEMERWADECLVKQEMVNVLELVKEGKHKLSNENINVLIDILKNK